VDALEIAQDVEVKRGGFEGLGAALAQPFQVQFGRGQFGLAQRGFFANQLARRLRS
jgi:hypothetical protein